MVNKNLHQISAPGGWWNFIENYLKNIIFKKPEIIIVYINPVLLV